MRNPEKNGLVHETKLLRDKQLRTAVHRLPALEFSKNTLHTIDQYSVAASTRSAKFHAVTNVTRMRIGAHRRRSAEDLPIILSAVS